MSTDTCVLFSFHLGHELDDAVQSSGHVYDDNILVRKHDRSSKFLLKQPCCAMYRFMW